MDTMLSVALSHQTALRRKMDLIANNLANMNTTAFKGEQMVFEEYLAKVDTGDNVYQEVSFVIDRGTKRDLSEGRFQSTGGTLDLAIEGPGFLVANTPDGERYTRNGHLRLDDEGQLVTSDGHPVLDEDRRPIVLSADETGLTISPDGTLSFKDGTITRVFVAEFNNPGAMKKAGNGLYATDEVPFRAEKSTLVQGVLETSNVTPILEMTRMIEVSRSYQSTARMMQDNSELMTRTIQRLGRPTA